MKKNIWITASSAFVVIFVSLLLMVACKKKEPPQAPTGLTSRVSGSSIIVSWNSVEDADDYCVEYTSGSHWHSETVYGTSFTDYSPDEGTNYYQVAAHNEYGYGEVMETSCYYSGNNGGGGGGGSSTISAPSGVSAEVSGSMVYVTWNSVSNASKYRVYRSSSGSGTYSMLDYTTSTYYYDSSPNTDNYYKVTAVNSNGDESEKSSSAYCHYSSGGGGGGSGSAPSAPTGVSAEVSGSKIYVSWNSVSNANEYDIYWSNSSGSGYQQIGTTSSTYYYDNTPGEYNYYKIKAKNNYGTSSYSSYAYCHYSSGGGGGSSNYAPCPPTVSASGTASSISVSWTKATGTGCGAPTSYKVYKRNPFTGSYEMKTTTTSTSYRDTDVHPGYNRYAVEAINDYGSDEGYGYSSSIALSKPSSFTAQKYQNTYIRCTWSKVSQATGYQISLSTTASGTYVWEQIDDVNTTTKDIYYPASSGTKVYLKVRAFYDAPYNGSIIYSDYTTYKTVTF